MSRSRQAEIRGASAALRERAAALRDWSEAARTYWHGYRGSGGTSRDLRDHERAVRRRAASVDAVPREAASHRARSGTREWGTVPFASLGSVDLAELLDALVGNGLTHPEASASLAMEMVCSGYPEDYPHVSAADAMEIFDRALGRRE
jgi:hypothetical protein